MRYGTSHFVTFSAAVRYYKPYGFNGQNVQRKLNEGEIHLGEPTLKAGEKLRIVDAGTRYEIDDGKP